ncbi:40S ribosomal protein S15 [Microtus ochrogaster]|uniref:40S ribosomal protein S15 n=1 Tax=Microtus ochrogaster TaxID=79684 RepID=A0A8J6GWJ4_MICOH|nr:40S ribosomal protein S15 [Microtus ochrogaster]
MAEVEMKKQIFLKFTYHGVDLDQLLDMCYEQMIHCTVPGSTPEPWPAADAAPTTQAPEKDQEGGASRGEAQGV